MIPKRNYKLLLSNLRDQLSTGVDGTGIMDGGRSSRSTRRINQIAIACEGAVSMGGHVYAPEIPCEDLITNQQVLDRERDNEEED